MANTARLSAAVLKRDIEAHLASRIPAALSPMTQPADRLWPTGVSAVDQLLGGGLPLGSLCEITAPECAGRTSLTLSLLASATRDGVTAYIDVSDALSPHSAAAAGVLLRNLLWVRFTAPALPQGPARKPQPATNTSREQNQSQQQQCGGPHPRGETKGLAPALEQMLFLKKERRRRKMEGTPGYPNQQLGLGEASADQVQWEQFNSRAVDDRDPLRAMDRASAEAARHRATAQVKAETPQQKQRPWTLLDQALRATDQVLQAGGFRVLVLDLASLPAEKAQRIPAASWWRFQKAAKHSDTVFLVLTPAPCARSTAACVLECSPAGARAVDGVLSRVEYRVEVSRQRTGASLGKRAPGRVASWDTAPAWMRAVGR